jgi:putative ABC transport system permease protein
MGLSNPQEAVGRQITVNDMKGDIIGVIGDFHGFSLHSEIQPIVFFNFWPRNFREAQILLDMNNVRGAINHIQEAWTEFYPEYIFQYEFLDDYIKSLYETESKLMIMTQSSSFLAILIACMGLLGLVSFMVLQRSKEIGIRKVLGATITSIYFMISKEFFRWVVIANIVAWPPAYYLAHEWLQEFAYHIPLGVGCFIIGGSISLGIAALVMSYQVMRAAIANPVEALRYE